MLTQELKDLAPGVAKPAFWLNRKGRIDADVFVVELGDRALIDLDVHQAASTARSLNEFIFGEEVVIEDVSTTLYRLALHGRLADRVLAAAAGRSDLSLAAHSATALDIAGGIAAYRTDQTGEPGFQLIMTREQAPSTWERLLAPDREIGRDGRRVRPIGWEAFNIARIEAGTPLFNIDFGPTNLPHETGVLDDRVSFTKGCYLGQEIVARMQNLGKPKQKLVGLRLLDDLLPVAGAQVFARDSDGSMGPEIGVVTSSTLSPMLGAAPVAFAMVKSSHSAPGHALLVNAEGEQAQAVVAPLAFWQSALHASSEE